jgi:hypothetical protein
MSRLNAGQQYWTNHTKAEYRSRLTAAISHLCTSDKQRRRVEIYQLLVRRPSLHCGRFVWPMVAVTGDVFGSVASSAVVALRCRVLELSCELVVFAVAFPVNGLVQKDCRTSCCCHNCHHISGARSCSEGLSDVGCRIHRRATFVLSRSC